MESGGYKIRGMTPVDAAGRDLLAEKGWIEWRSFPRIVRGAEPGWQPAMIWGEFNHAMG